MSMNIVYHESSKCFHLYNDSISYILCILRNGQLGQLYCGARIHDREDFGYLLELAPRAMSACVYENDRSFSLEHIKQELPSYGSSDYRAGAVELLQPNGSRLTDFRYESHRVSPGKPKLHGLPATYTEADDEALTLTVTLLDTLTGVRAELNYTIFREYAAIARSVRYENQGDSPVTLTRAMSLCLDLPDCDYQWLQFSGRWAGERQIITRELRQGTTSVGSLRGHSSHHQNPFVVIKRPMTDENHGEALGLSLVYSGNFLMQAEVDAHNTLRLMAGIHPDGFGWKLEAGEAFQTPEAVLVYSGCGLGGMSRTFHKLYARRLARGVWRDKPRPILINNWEATYFDFTEEKLLGLARQAKDCGIELFVLDDGWFGRRKDDRSGLGDWTPNPQRLPNGIAGLAEMIEELGMSFGLWFEPEAISRNSALYEEHPDWLLSTPGRNASHGRYEFLLDFSRAEVVDNIYRQMAAVLGGAKVSYVKWDMNRSISECYSLALPPERQGEVFHRYILGVYELYERLTSEFPHILFESCSGGGGRFDPGMLYYAPQAWASDNTDAVERLRIQYGTSFCYPISSIGAHVSAVPNHQMFRYTPLSTRANVACFGTFGYELDLGKLDSAELDEIRRQVAFMKENRELLQFGDFYRLESPFEGNTAAWMVVSPDRRRAIVGYYRALNKINDAYTRLHLCGLDPDLLYREKGSGALRFGDELMRAGLITSDSTAGEILYGIKPSSDFASRLYVLEAAEE